MLSQLSIRNIVLIERLDLEFIDGLTVLTGETGAGKSILLDGLSLALGARGDGGLVRNGAEQGSITAVFELSPSHPARMFCRENELPDEDSLILRRVQSEDGRTRAYINDQPVSVQLLRRVGATLVEIHGQHDERALLDQDAHRDLLDAFAGVEGDVVHVGEAWQAWRDGLEALKAHEAALEKSRADEDFLRHAVQELEKLSVETGEEDQLAETRQLMMHAEKFSTDLSEAYDSLAGNSVADARLNAALRKLERNQDKAGGRFDTAIGALERAIMELGEARSAISQALHDVEYDPQTLEQSEERLFELRAAARKYNTTVDDLPGVAADMADKLEAINHDEHLRADLKARVDACEAAYSQLARSLSEKRHKDRKSVV